MKEQGQKGHRQDHLPQGMDITRWAICIKVTDLFFFRSNAQAAQFIKIHFMLFAIVVTVREGVGAIIILRIAVGVRSKGGLRIRDGVGV